MIYIYFSYFLTCDTKKERICEDVNEDAKMRWYFQVSLIMFGIKIREVIKYERV